MKPEVMSPAGYWPQLRAAVDAGADAVYFGLKHFSARAKVGFALDELPEAMRTLHGRGVRGYLTFNTLVFGHELAGAAEAIAAAARAGVDALIVQDVGILKLARQMAPALELHASTQMSVTDAAGVLFAQSLGASRVTLARELSLEEVRKIREQTGAGLEIFVHGALCVAYSGQCFSSEAWGGRSANRGQCAQACRLPYELMVDGEHKPLGDARYLLSPGDLCTVHQVPEMIAAGVAALKIEGRYKDEQYVALTTNAYRKAVDDAWAGRPVRVTPEDELRLEQVYSRGLGAHFVGGTNHQAVVRGRAPRHRGVLMGRVLRVGEASVVIEPAAAHRISPLKAGDGVVFDAADWRSPGEPEEGGRVFEVRQHGGLEVSFGNGLIQFARIRPGDLLWRTHDPALSAVSVPVHRQAVEVSVTARVGEPLKAEWHVGALAVRVESDRPLQPAENRALDLQTLREQFGRLGNTPYRLSNLVLAAEGEPFAPVSLLNRLRREAVEKLQSAQNQRSQIEVHDPILPVRNAGTVERGEPEIHLLVRNPEQLEAALDLKPASITLDYLDLYGLRPSVDRVRQSGIAARVASPRILKPGEARIVDFLLALDCEILVRAAGILHTLRSKTKPILIGDFSLNAANSMSAMTLFEMGIDRLTPGHDLNAAQIADLASSVSPLQIEAIAYQHLPVFHTEHCVFCRFLSTGTSYKDCGRPCEKHRVELRDQNGRAHPVSADVGCRNTVFNAQAQEAGAYLELWREAGIRHFRLEFAHETGDRVRRVTEAFKSALDRRTTPAQLQRDLRAAAQGGTTEGSLFIAGNYLELPILQ